MLDWQRKLLDALSDAQIKLQRMRASEGRDPAGACWTRDKPTRDGVYWMLRPGEKEAEISEVWHGKALEADVGLDLADPDTYPGALWYGPIAPPALPDPLPGLSAS